MERYFTVLPIESIIVCKHTLYQHRNFLIAF
jgi:hypothetical protein